MEVFYMADTVNPIVSENQFWLQIFGDKARILANEIYTQETVETGQARSFITLFDDLLAQSRQTMPNDQLNQLDQLGYKTVQDFRKFVLHLIRIQISEKTIIGITPALLDVFVNETELYLNILNAYIKNTPYIVNAVNEIIIWMLNAYIGAIHLEENIGVTFIEYKRKAEIFANEFLNLYFRAFVLNGLRRSGLDSFPALDQFYDDVEITMTKYAEYVVDIMKLLESRRILGSLTLLDLDDLYRILCYIMTKISSVSKIKAPVCDPTSPRRE
jgi:hypothetical protein